MIFGDLAFIMGIIGIVIYLCLILIRFTTNSGKIVAIGKRYDEEIVRLKQRIKEWKKELDEINPQMNALVSKMVELREIRDQLYFQYEAMVEEAQERKVSIKYKGLN